MMKMQVRWKGLARAEHVLSPGARAARSIHNEDANATCPPLLLPDLLNLVEKSKKRKLVVEDDDSDE